MSRLKRSRQGHHTQALISHSAGFTLLEMMAVVSVMGLIGAIAAPAWQSYNNRVMLSVGQDQVLQTMRQAQSSATTRKVTWQSSFREVNGRVQGAFHPADAFPQEIVWESLPDGVHIDVQRSSLHKKDDIYRVQFNHHGHVSGRLGRLTLMSQDRSRLRSCVIASTLVGALRVDREVKSKDKGCSPAK